MPRAWRNCPAHQRRESWCCANFSADGDRLTAGLPYRHGWTLYPSAIFAFFALLCFIVDIFGRRDGPIWKDRGQG